ncbi:MAG: UDP-N-acetylmuramoyl-L-alanine--D-glutamate ligase [Candidatus Gracilibacteria bacterium]|nr:UDP-N-acetylmuramoyl-L-alanine--D-glutamate ligase [Candidatus Gracilibacteria bacterium]
MKTNLIHKNIAILGFGKEGESTLRFLQKNGILDGSVTILDKNLNLKISNFDGKVIVGENYLNDLEKYDYIFKSPGISLYTNNLLYLKDKILTQTKLFFEFYKGKIISITQTKGKSTTATLVYQLLKNAGYNAKLVGNIGNPVLDEIDIEKDNYDFVVYELSSYMLEDLENHHSFISILGNIFPDHLDWHLNFENYSKAKKNILKNSDNILVGLGLYPKIEKELLNRKFLTFGPKDGYISHFDNSFFINGEKIDIKVNPKIPGEHNLNNFCSILATAHIIGIDYNIFEKTINEFEGLPHRLQNIGNYKGITFIDDAISTTPESTIEGIKSFNGLVQTIYLGGTDRGYDFKNLVKILEQYNIKNIVLFPDSGKRIKKLLRKANYNILETKNMKEAVIFSFKNTQAGKICLLSNAGPSYSLWKNFGEKGDEFKQEILNQYKNLEQ